MHPYFPEVNCVVSLHIMAWVVLGGHWPPQGDRGFWVGTGREVEDGSREWLGSPTVPNTNINT